MAEELKPTIGADEDISKEKNGKWQDLVNYCLDIYEDIGKSAYRGKKIAENRQSREAYEQVEKTATEPWDGASNIPLPLTTISCDNLEPRLVSGFIGKQPYLQLELENEEEPDETTKTLQTWFNQELQDVVKIENVTNEMIHLMLLEGTIFPIPQYNLDEEIKRDFIYDERGDVVINPETGEPEVEDKHETVFEGGRIELAPFKDVFIPDDVDDWEKAPVIRRIYPTYAELQRDSRDKEGYFNIGTWLCKEDTAEKLTDDSQSAAQALGEASVTGKETIECIECSVRYVYQEEDQEKEDITDFDEQRLVVQIALDKKIIVRLVLLRQLNFKNEHLIKRVRLFPEKGLSYGTSMYGKISSIQKGASRTFNMAINIAEVILIPWFLYTERVGLKGDKKLRPGMGIQVDSANPNDLYFPRFSINPDQMFNYLSIWQGFWERLVNISDPQIGRTSDQKTTATEVMAVIEEGRVSTNYQAKKTKEEFLSIPRTIWDLYYQHMPFTKTFRQNGQDIPIPRAEMRRGYKFRLTGSSEMSNKLIERKQNEDLFRMIVEDERNIANPVKAWEELLASYGKTDKKAWINPDIARVVNIIAQMPEVMPLFEQAVAQAQQAAQNIEQESKARAAAAAKIAKDAMTVQ